MLYLSNRTQSLKQIGLSPSKHLEQDICMQHVRQDPWVPCVPCDIFFINVVVLLAWSSNCIAPARLAQAAVSSSMVVHFTWQWGTYVQECDGRGQTCKARERCKGGASSGYFWKEVGGTTYCLCGGCINAITQETNEARFVEGAPMVEWAPMVEGAPMVDSYIYIYIYIYI